MAPRSGQRLATQQEELKEQVEVYGKPVILPSTDPVAFKRMSDWCLAFQWVTSTEEEVLKAWSKIRTQEEKYEVYQAIMMQHKPIYSKLKSQIFSLFN